MIETPRQPQNVAFSGPDRRYLYIVGRGGVYRVRTETRGVQTRVK
jgi:gluconolactonase